MQETSPKSPKQTAILDAAQQRFAHYGLSKTTMDEIAGDLGMSKASLYYYFETKEEIFREVIAREQDEFIALSEEVVSGSDTPDVKFRAYCRNRLTYLNELANLKLLGLQSWHDVKPIVSDLMQSFTSQERAFLCRMLDEGTQSGFFELSRTSEETASALLDVFYGLGFRIVKSLSIANTSYEGLLPQLHEETDLLVDVLLHGLVSRTRA